MMRTEVSYGTRPDMGALSVDRGEVEKLKKMMETKLSRKPWLKIW